MRAGIQAGILLIAVQAGVGEAPAQDAAEAPAQDAAEPGVTVEERLERIENMLSNQGLLELVQQLQNLELEISRLRGDVEVHNHTLEQLKKRQRDLYADIDRRIQRIETPVTAIISAAEGTAGPPLQTLSPFAESEVTGGQQADTPLTLELVDQVGQEPAPGSEGEDIVPLSAPPGQPTEPVFNPGAVGQPAAAAQDMALSETPAAIVAGTPGLEPAQAVISAAPAAVDPALIEAAYRHAFNLLKQSLYDPAIKAFREFLTRYPHSEYAGNAQFWLAEAYYVNSRFGQALVEYSNLIQRHPDSPKLVQAKLKAAFSQHEMDQPDAAARQLDEIIQQHPGTTAASLAQDRLKQIAATSVN